MHFLSVFNYEIKLAVGVGFLFPVGLLNKTVFLGVFRQCIGARFRILNKVDTLFDDVILFLYVAQGVVDV